MAKKKTMVYLTEEQQWQLKRHAQQTGNSMAGLIRTAVDEFLARERPPVDYMSIVGVFETEPDNASQRVDEIVGKAIEEDYLRVQEDYLRRQAVEDEKVKQQPGPRKRGKHPSPKKKSA